MSPTRINLSRRAGRAALATVLSAGLLATGGTVVAPAVAHAAEAGADAQAPADNKNAEGKSPRGTALGKLSVAGDVRPGGVLTIVGTDLARDATKGDVNFKLDDGSGKYSFPDDQTGGNGQADGGTVNVPVRDQNPWTARLVLPADISEGWHWVRLLAGSTDGGNPVSDFVWFKVDKNAAVVSVSATAPVASRGGVSSTITISGAKANSPVAVSYQGKDLGAVGSTDASGALSAAVKLPKGVAVVAGQEYVFDVTVGGQQYSATAVGGAKVTLSTKSLKKEVSVKVDQLPDGASVTYAGTEKVQWNKSTATASEGSATLEGLTVAGEIGDAIIVKYTIGGKEYVENTGVAVAAAEEDVNADQFDLVSTVVKAGLYQSAYVESDDTIIVTRAVGRPPITDSGLIKLKASDLSVVAQAESVKSTANPDWVDKGAVRAVYGVNVDQERNLVWTTDTRDNGISIYDAKTLAPVYYFGNGSLNHGRDVQVDQTTHKAYASSAAGSEAVVTEFTYDPATGKGTSTAIALEGFSGPTASLDFDQATGSLFVVQLNGTKVAKINVRGEKPTVEYIDFGHAEELQGVIGLTYVAETNEVWVAAQGSNRVASYNLETGATELFDTGAGALNVKYEPVSKTVLVSNFGGGTVTVIGAKSHTILGQLTGAAARVNHISVDGKGNAYAVNKGTVEREGQSGNQVTKITPKFVDGAGSADSTDADDQNNEQAKPSLVDTLLGWLKNLWPLIVGGLLWTFHVPILDFIGSVLGR